MCTIVLVILSSRERGGRVDGSFIRGEQAKLLRRLLQLRTIFFRAEGENIFLFYECRRADNASKHDHLL